jgi:hypothetical protein
MAYGLLVWSAAPAADAWQSAMAVGSKRSEKTTRPPSHR